MTYPEPHYDYVLFIVESEYEEYMGEKKQILFDDAYFNEEMDTRHIHKRISGEVVGVPQYFSNEVVTMTSVGIPPYKTYLSSDLIQYKVNLGLGRDWGRQNYQPSLYDYKKHHVTVKDYGKYMDIQKGDKIYFDYTTLCEDNQVLFNFNERKVYKVRIDEVFCAVRDGKIIPQSQRVFVEPEFTKIQTNLILPEHLQKEEMALNGWIRHIRPDHECKAGDKVCFDVDCEFENKIEGGIYYIMQEKNLLGVYENSHV